MRDRNDKNKIGIQRHEYYDKIGVLSWHISKKRKRRDAKILFQKVLEVAGVKPKESYN